MKKALLYSFITILIIILLFVLVVIVYFNYKTKDTILDLNKLEKTNISTLIADNGNIMNEDNYVIIEDIPKRLIDCFISIEDKKFYDHNGIDIHRMFGALLYNITHGKRAQGASTITQQFIKNTYLSNKKTFDRKLKEIKLALLLEKELTKDEILERYLNSLYFGNGIYGIKEASIEIFGKKLNELDVAECATLAGIIKAPTYYSPLNNIENSMNRRNVVLDSIYNDGLISKDELDSAKNSKITLNNELFHNSFDDFYIKQVLNQASDCLNMTISEIMSAGFKIATFYDEDAQKVLYTSIKDTITNKEYSALSMMMDNSTCGVKACYGNNNVNVHEFRRQVGSTMKPLAVYLPALESGIIQPAYKVDDTLRVINNYSPHNYGDIYRGKISIRDAVMHSSNIVAVDILNNLSINRSKDFLSKMNIDLVDNGLSIALGGLNQGLTPIELIGGYATIANRGCYSEPTFIKYIQDEQGRIIYRYNKLNRKICEESSAYLMTDMLVSTAKNGTARKLSNLPFDVASKTGTVSNILDVNGNIDAYNMSYTSEDTLLVWLGGNLPCTIQGGGLPTIIARNIYENVYNNVPNSFIIPSTITNVSFDRSSYDNDAQILISDSINAYSDIFDNRYLPTEHLIEEKDITYKYDKKELTIENALGTTIKVIKEDIFGNKVIIKEIFNAESKESILLDRNIFNKYIIEISYENEIIKAISL